MTRTFLTEGKAARCLVCPHSCLLHEGRKGICGVRANQGGEIKLLTDGVLSSISLDPIEKKPLYHFYPGSMILSIGSFGCNMRCDFCQNWHISSRESMIDGQRTDPSKIIDKAISTENNIGIAYTYNEPVIWYEFVKKVGLLAMEAGLKNVMVSNGFVSDHILDDYLNFIDAFNIDLKAFNEKFYRDVAGADLGEVKKSLGVIARSGRHLEITTLVIPGLNDSADEMKEEVNWISNELGSEVPFHLSRYFPMHERSTPMTPSAKLEELYSIAADKLRYVYLGNIRSDKGESTRCPSCGTVVTSRSGYITTHRNIENGFCSVCGHRVYRDFIFSPLKRN
ncbi:MAG: AmmeMemoRadiSam system radical SAM enzyme [Bacteroidales bacterium]